jgi:aryl-phospho-beta-D-glucosidase BglC (GH1 family)
MSSEFQSVDATEILKPARVAGPGSGVSRRRFLRFLTAAAGVAAVPIAPGYVVKEQEPANKTAASKPADGNPRWYGFNLLEYFSTDPDWMKYFPYKNDGMFLEDDFRWIRDWGFNFVRLPMDYRFWT